MAALDRQRILKGHTMHQLAEVLDVSYGYLQQLRTGSKPIPKISDKLTHRCARYLETARIQVLLIEISGGYPNLAARLRSKLSA